MHDPKRDKHPRPEAWPPWVLAAVGLAAVAITFVFVQHDPPPPARALLIAGWSIFLLSYWRRP